MDFDSMYTDSSSVTPAIEGTHKPKHHLTLIASEFVHRKRFSNTMGALFYLKGKYVMVKFTQSLAQWLFRNHKEIMPLIAFGHVELFTEEMQQEYLAWCETDEGKKCLKGGECYKEE